MNRVSVHSAFAKFSAQAGCYGLLCAVLTLCLGHHRIFLIVLRRGRRRVRQQFLQLHRQAKGETPCA
jgi:hypothetical protein